MLNCDLASAWGLDFWDLDWSYSKQRLEVAEPAGAASVAALEVLREYIKGKTICCAISGGNNDINRMPEMMEERAIYDEYIKHYFIINFPQRPELFENL